MMILSALALLILLAAGFLVVREIVRFYTWRSSLERLSRYEWSRRLDMLNRNS